MRRTMEMAKALRACLIANSSAPTTRSAAHTRYRTQPTTRFAACGISFACPISALMGGLFSGGVIQTRPPDPVQCRHENYRPASRSDNATHTRNTVACVVRCRTVLLALGVATQKRPGIRRLSCFAQFALPIRRRREHFFIPRCEVGTHFHRHYSDVFWSRSVLGNLAARMDAGG